MKRLEMRALFILVIVIKCHAPPDLAAFCEVFTSDTRCQVNAEFNVYNIYNILCNVTRSLYHHFKVLGVSRFP